MTPQLGTVATNARFGLRKRQTVPEGQPGAAREVARPATVVLTAVWFGLVAGILELLVLAVNRDALQRVVLDWLRLSRHASWMVPVADLGLFILAGLLLVAAARLSGRVIFPVALGVLGGLAALAPLLTMHRLHPLACVLLATGVGARFATMNPGRLSRLQYIIRFSLPALAVLTAAWCAYDYQRVSGAERRTLSALPPAAPGAPNVLLVVLDTVRADHMSGYGYERATTPRLDALARRGVQFDRAVSTAPWTLPAHASLFTGRWHSALTASAERKLDSSFPVLAEFLRDHGYATAGFVGNTTNCNTCYGFDRGFARYEDFHGKMTVSPIEILNCSEFGRRLFQIAGLAARLKLDPHSDRKDAPTINRDVLSWLDQQKGRPFFAFLNYYDAHDPFILPDGVAPRYGPAQRSPKQDRVLRHWFHPGPAVLPTDDAKLIRDAYDDGITYLDDQVGRLLDSMKERGLLENTIVIVTSDHGENLGEHDLYSHGRSLYQPEVHVPLLIAGPQIVPPDRRVATVASVRDVPATVADLVGLGASSPFPGRSLARCWRDGTQAEVTDESPVISEVFIRTKPGGASWLSPALRGPIRAAFLGDMKYIWYGDGTEELFDLSADPGETKNLAGSSDLRKYREALAAVSAVSKDQPSLRQDASTPPLDAHDHPAAE